MAADNAHIISQLRKDILLLQGFKPPAASSIDTGLGRIAEAFPQRVFPTGAIHEFISQDSPGGGSFNSKSNSKSNSGSIVNPNSSSFNSDTSLGDSAATCGFVSGILSSLMNRGGACLWIARDRKIFPPALAAFGIAPHRIIFIDLKKDTDILWAVEESLKCHSLAAVVGEIRDLSPIASRRLQLAVEHSSVTGFLLRNNPRRLDTIACVARWRINSLPSRPAEPGMPGVGHIRWNIELSKVRNGRPGTWEVEWSAGRFHVPEPEHSKSLTPATYSQTRRKAG